MANTQGGPEESPAPPTSAAAAQPAAPAQNVGPGHETEPAPAPPAPDERSEKGPDRQGALPATVVRAFTAVGAVVGVLAGISVFTAPFAKTGSALILTTVAVLAAATLLAAGFVSLSTHRGKRITAPARALAVLVVLALAAGAGVGYAGWHRPASHTPPVSTAPVTTPPVFTAPVTTAPPTAATIPVGPAPVGTVVYDQTVGEGCQHPGGGTSITVDQPPRVPAHPWTPETAKTWAIPSCSNALLYSELSGNDAAWINDFEWTFRNVPAGAPCWFSVYIANSPYSRYSQAQYYWTDKVGTYPQDASFIIDQGGTRGAWVQEYSTAAGTSTGTAQLLLADAGSGDPGETVTASAVRLECT